MLVVRTVGLRLPVTFCSYMQGGIACLRLYQPIQNLSAGTKLAKPLKPPLRMELLLCAAHFIYSFTS